MTKKYTILVLFVLFIISSSLNAQLNKISGTIEDLTTGEHLISAFIYDTLSMKGTTSNYYGFYSLPLKSGKVRIVYSYVGYKPYIIEFYLNKDTLINVKLDPQQMLEEVVVTSSGRNLANSTQMGLIEMSAIQTKQLPVLMGEADIIKTIQLLPGIKGGTEGTSGMYVRGGGPDQNLILLDGVPVYNINHLFGFFSVFNSDAIQNFSLLKGGFPARYGGRLSSVLDIKMKEGNNKKFSGNVSIGLISSKATLEGPIKDEQTSFIVSARRTYLDILLYPLTQSMTEGNSYGGYFFYDINAKINHKFSNRSRIYYSFYKGLDKFYFKEKEKTLKSTASSGWGNDIHSFRWNYVISDNLFSNYTATYSHYKFFIRYDEKVSLSTSSESGMIEYSSGITDYGLKADFDYIPSTRHYIRFGTNYTYHSFNPGVNIIKLNYSEENSQNDLKIDTSFGNFGVYAHEYFIYAEDDFELTDKFKINIGAHFSTFIVKKKNYYSIQPRFSMRYLIHKNLSFKASVVQMTQYVQLLSTANIGLPTDLWVPATNKIKPMKSWQYSTGIAYSPNDMYEFSIEAYYKPMYNIIEYKEGASFVSINNSWENKVEAGKGWGKGIEFLINKKTGKLNGWIGYTLSYADRQFENISGGAKFPYKYDRRHDISIALNYKPSFKFDIGATWMYATGEAVTLAEVQYNSPYILYQNYHNTIEYHYCPR